ncbi:MAG: phosphoribosyl-ATP pyrophosphohydrolase [Rhodobacteraceae bacterium]|nr:phosphoribosyl-ATP pyrophosphohydrolase [Paracoccaceae bacterium]
MKPKLVRDYIPEIIEKTGSICVTRLTHGIDEHMIMLKEKMHEETREFIQNPCYEEAADMLEVIKAFCHLSELEFNKVEEAAQKKKDERGSFSRGIILEKVLYET